MISLNRVYQRHLYISFVFTLVISVSSAAAAPASGINAAATPISGSISIPAGVWTSVSSQSFSAKCENGISLVGAVTPDFSSYILALVKEGREGKVEQALVEPIAKTAAKLVKREGKKSLLSLGLISPTGFALVGTGKKFLNEFSKAMNNQTPDVNRAYEIVSTTSFFPQNTSAMVTANNILKVKGKTAAVATGVYLLGATAGQAPGNQFMGLLCRNAAAVYYPPVGVVYTEGASNMAQVRQDFENSGLLNTQKLLNAIVLADSKAK